MNTPRPNGEPPFPMPSVDTDVERVVAMLPLRTPSASLDARIAATAHFEARPRISRLRWPAAAAALLLLALGLALGWIARSAAPVQWLPTGTDWATAGIADLGARPLPDGRIVHPAGAVLIRRDRLQDPRTGATVEIQTIEPRILIIRPIAD